MLAVLDIVISLLDFFISDLPEEERIIKANLEKEKGNEAFRAGDFAESLIYYSRSISLHESAAVYNNRAITYIKIEKFEDAIIECNTVLKLEPKNVKGKKTTFQFVFPSSFAIFNAFVIHFQCQLLKSILSY